MKIAIYGRPNRGQTQDCALLLIALLDKHQIAWCISDKLAELLGKAGQALPQGQIYTPEDGLPQGCDVVCSLGGDGTLLEAVAFTAHLGVPVAAVHTGRLGFLSTTSFGGLDDLVRRLQSGDYGLDERTMLQLDDPTGLFGSRNFALNEVAIMKRDTGAMITVHAFLNGAYLNSYWADGLIIATPTGSTGYSLSCGGPIVMPASRSFVLTPVAPHNLNVRPLVIPDESHLAFTVEGRSKKWLLSLDTRSRPIEMDERFEVCRSSFAARLVRLPQDSFTDTLRSKLYWGADLRN